MGDINPECTSLSESDNSSDPDYNVKDDDNLESDSDHHVLESDRDALDKDPAPGSSKPVKSGPTKEDFRCTFEGCNKKYSKRFRLTRHIRRTHEKMTITYVCPKCEIPLSSLDSLRKHIKRIHERALPTCEFCQATFRKHNQLKAHRYIHTQEKPFKCDVADCGQSFVTQRNLNRHKKIHDKYACKHEGCSEIFNSWTALRKHVLLKHPLNLACSVCKKTFFSKRRLRYHEAIHQQDREVFECPYDKCPRFYYYKRNLTHHIQSSHLGKFFLCPVKGCLQQLSTKQRLELHMRLHDPKKAIPKKKSAARERPAKPRKPRKDKGIPKVPIISLLTGVSLDKDTSRSTLKEAKLNVEIELMRVENECDIVLPESCSESSSEGQELPADHSIGENLRSCNNTDKSLSSEVVTEISIPSDTQPSTLQIALSNPSSSLPEGKASVTRTNAFIAPRAGSPSTNRARSHPNDADRPYSSSCATSDRQASSSRKRTSRASNLHDLEQSSSVRKRHRSESDGPFHEEVIAAMLLEDDSVKIPEHILENVFLGNVASGYQSSSESEKEK